MMATMMRDEIQGSGRGMELEVLIPETRALQDELLEKDLG